MWSVTSTSAATLTDRALVLNPNLVWAWLFGGWVKLWRGEPEVAIERFARAQRLSPNDPQFSMHDGIGAAHFAAGRYAEALSETKAALREQPAFILSLSIAAASGALTGQLEQAERAIASLLRLEPTLRFSGLKERFPEFSRPEVFAKFAEGLRRAGLPE